MSTRREVSNVMKLADKGGEKMEGQRVSMNEILNAAKSVDLQSISSEVLRDAIERVRKQGFDQDNSIKNHKDHSDYTDTAHSDASPW